MPGLILLDCGNTCLKLGAPDPSGLTRPERVRSVALSEIQDRASLSGWIAASLRAFQLEPSDISHCAVVCVVPRMEELIIEAWRKSGVKVLFAASKELPVPLDNQYLDPSELGADRLVGTFAASRLVCTPSSIIVSFGTATTFDCLEGNTYLGGAIAPGLHVSARALAERTAKLPEADLAQSARPPLPALSTREALRAGFIYGFAAMAEGMIKRLKEHLTQPSTVIITGGLAPVVMPALEIDYEYRPNLQLDGLALTFLAARPAQGDK